MCLEPCFLGGAPRGSRCKRFAMLKSGFEEAFRDSYETSQYGNEPLSSHKFALKLPWQSDLFSSGLGVQALCNCHTVTEMQQGGCCFTKGEMLVLLLHWAPPFVLSWVGRGVGRGAVRADQTSATAKMSVQNVWSQPPVTHTLKWKEMPYSTVSEKWGAQHCCFQGCRGLQIVKITFACLSCN